MFGHLPLHPGSAPAVCLLWNYEEVLSILQSYTCVAATLAGHTHSDGYAVDESGIHHRVLSAVLECPPGSAAYAYCDVHADRLVLRGVDRLASAEYSISRRPALAAAM